MYLYGFNFTSHGRIKILKSNFSFLKIIYLHRIVQNYTELCIAYSFGKSSTSTLIHNATWRYLEVIFVCDYFA